jgi:outer membrane protein insertion porin family
MIGGIHSSDESQFIPVEDRFYSGGSNSNRGWARSMLGPIIETQDGTSIIKTPEGGKSIVEMNLEIRHPLFWQIELAAFVDAANVWSPSYHYCFNQLWYAVGGGIRVNTPIGPVRLDVGVPVVGTADRKVQIFLSVGQAF